MKNFEYSYLVYKTKPITLFNTTNEIRIVTFFGLGLKPTWLAVAPGVFRICFCSVFEIHKFPHLFISGHFSDPNFKIEVFGALGNNVFDLVPVKNKKPLDRLTLASKVILANPKVTAYISEISEAIEFANLTPLWINANCFRAFFKRSIFCPNGIDFNSCVCENRVLVDEAKLKANHEKYTKKPKIKLKATPVSLALRLK